GIRDKLVTGVQTCALPIFAVTEAQAGQTLAAALRQWLPGESWSRVRGLVAGRRVQIDGDVVLDPARRIRDGQVVTLLPSAAAPRSEERRVGKGGRRGCARG